MKPWIIYTIVLSSWMIPARACGPYYPYGEDVRFSILDPAAFGYPDFCGFHYSANLYYKDGCMDNNEESGRQLNAALWKAYCNNKVDTASIYLAIYSLGEKDFYNSAMVRYLRQANDTLAIHYLEFARRCNDYNTWMDDPWERNNQLQTTIRIPLIKQALDICKATTNIFIQKRYAFLAIRLAYYNADEKTVQNIYRQYFGNQKKKKNIVDYWALYFRAITDTNDVVQNYYLALVYANAPDKRLGISQRYNRDVPLTSILALAKNNAEKTAICLINDLKNVGKGLLELKYLYRLQPNSRAFCFLLLREINKLEDWIYTPYYTYFQPSIVNLDSYFSNGTSDSKDDSKLALARVEKDRLYAKELLQFVQAVNAAKAENPLVVKTVKAYLQLMSYHYEACLATFTTIPPQFQPAQGIKALCLVAMQKNGQCQLTAAIKPLLLQQDKAGNNKLLFAIARELEYKGNTTTAALLYSKVNQGNDDAVGTSAYVYWRTKKNHNTLGLDFYEDYFFYLDAEYTAAQLQALITGIEKNKNKNNAAFEKWAYSDIAENIERLYDLLGTKYIRLNQLQKAYAAFKMVHDSTWNSGAYPYLAYLNANSFYTNFYAEHRPTKADTIHFTKTTLTAVLINYLQEADHVKNPNRDYYYFLVANCYFNMTQYGNSWMMRRYFWTTDETRTKLPDDEEYFQANQAKAYYLKAAATAKTPQFGALCLRMAGRCENYRQRDIANIQYEQNPQSAGAETGENRYYKAIKTKYPQDYEILLSNCYSFDHYFKARQDDR